MDHVAILRKKKVSKGDNLLGDIVDRKKTIESRWYVHKISPWNQIDMGDTVYFKESGGPVTAVATVSKVMQFNLNIDASAVSIIRKFGKFIAPKSTTIDLDKWAAKLENKRYCILIFLENARLIKPFNINKTGFGISAAWMYVKDINTVKIP